MSDGDKHWATMYLKFHKDINIKPTIGRVEKIQPIKEKIPTEKFCGQCEYEKNGAYYDACHNCIFNDIHYDLKNNFKIKEVKEYD